MARNAAGEGELSEQALHALFIERNIRVDLAVGPLQVSVRDQAGTAMPGTRDVDHVEIALLDHPVQVNVDEIQAWRCSPMAQKPGLDVVLCERLFYQRIVIQIDLADREGGGGPPVRLQHSP